MIFDTHTHLHFSDYDEDREEVIERARKKGVGALIEVGVDLEDSRKAIELAQRYEFIYTAIGVHPHYADKAEIEKFEALAEEKKVVAIGEVGIDYFRSPVPKSVQQRVFRQFIRLAKKHNLPVIVHSRSEEKEGKGAKNAYLDALKILKEEKVEKGVFHCFCADRELAKEVLETGFFLSFTGNLTYPNAQTIRDTLKFTPLERMLLETDCPFLPPQEKRGKRNEPAYLRYVLYRLAEIKEISLADIEKITTRNAQRLFGV